MAGKRKPSKAEELFRRSSQLDSTSTALSKLRGSLQSVRKHSQDCKNLDSHLLGFYDEVDKLAKGKALFPATDLIVEGTNNIIRDTKALIDGDTYVDRIKEFVPAGDNPVYPDIVVVLRVIRQATARFKTVLDARSKRLEEAIREATLIEFALKCYVEEEGYIVTSDDINESVGTPVSGWLEPVSDDDGDDTQTFNFDRLDRLDVSAHLLKDSDTDDGKE